MYNCTWSRLKYGTIAQEITPDTSIATHVMEELGEGEQKAEEDKQVMSFADCVKTGKRNTQGKSTKHRHFSETSKTTSKRIATEAVPMLLCQNDDNSQKPVETSFESLVTGARPKEYCKVLPKVPSKDDVDLQKHVRTSSQGFATDAEPTVPCQKDKGKSYIGHTTEDTPMESDIAEALQSQETALMADDTKCSKEEQQKTGEPDEPDIKHKKKKSKRKKKKAKVVPKTEPQDMWSTPVSDTIAKDLCKIDVDLKKSVGASSEGIVTEAVPMVPSQDDLDPEKPVGASSEGFVTGGKPKEDCKVLPKVSIQEVVGTSDGALVEGHATEDRSKESDIAEALQSQPTGSTLASDVIPKDLCEVKPMVPCQDDVDLEKPVGVSSEESATEAVPMIPSQDDVDLEKPIATSSERLGTGAMPKGDCKVLPKVHSQEDVGTSDGTLAEGHATEDRSKESDIAEALQSQDEPGIKHKKKKSKRKKRKAKVVPKTEPQDMSSTPVSDTIPKDLCKIDVDLKKSVGASSEGIVTEAVPMVPSQDDMDPEKPVGASSEGFVTGGKPKEDCKVLPKVSIQEVVGTSDGALVEGHATEDRSKESDIAEALQSQPTGSTLSSDAIHKDLCEVKPMVPCQDDVDFEKPVGVSSEENATEAAPMIPSQDDVDLEKPIATSSERLGTGVMPKGDCKVLPKVPSQEDVERPKGTLFKGHAGVDRSDKAEALQSQETALMADDTKCSKEEQQKTDKPVMSYADCVKTGKTITQAYKTNCRRYSSQRHSEEWKLFSLATESDAASISSFRFDEEEDDVVDSDLEVEEEGNIEIEDDTETWFERSCNKYDFEDSNSLHSDKDIFDTNILTDGVELSDEYMDKFIKASDSLKRANFYTLDSVPKCVELCKANPSTYVICKLNIQSAHRAVATLLNPRKNLETIEILGRSKCGQAFTEDKVIVEILKRKNRKDGTSDRMTEKQEADAYGKVVGIYERVRHRDVEHPVFIATPDPHQGNLMLPVCKTIPKISVLNTNIKKKFPRQMMYKVEVYKYMESRGKLQFTYIQDIRPEERHQYRFIVCYLTWGEKYVYPRGAVIGVIRTDDIGTGLKLIGIQNQVPTLYKESTVREVQGIIKNGSREVPSSSREDLTCKVYAFTIDPPNSRDLDDALSVEKIREDTFSVGVHISDVSATIPLDSDIDREARSRCSTYYSIPMARSLHMFPEPLSQDRLSLLPNQKRAAISIFFTMKANGIIEGTPKICRTLIQTKHRFTYKEVQDIINSTCPDRSPARLYRDIKYLNMLARHRRIDRLKGALNSYPVEFDYALDANDIVQNIDAHNLVEEFMIMANHGVGQFLEKECSGVVPLRCQDNPCEETLASWLNKNTYLADIIVALQDLKLSTASGPRTMTIANVPNARWTRLIPVQTWVWKAVVDAAKNGKIERVRQLMGCDDLHPQQSFALQEWISFQETACYQRARSENVTKVNGGHFSLGMENYVHFTSPIRRYVDIVIHRLLHAVLDGEENLPYTEEEIDDICNNMNQVRQRTKTYQKQSKLLLLSTKLKSRPQKLVGFVEDMSDEGVILHFPGIQHVPKQNRMLKFRLLEVCSQPQQSEDLDIIQNTKEKRDLTSVMWQRRIFLHKGLRIKNRSTENKETDDSAEESIDPHQRSTFLKYTAWVEMLTQLLNREDNDGLLQTIEETENDIMFGATRKYVKSCLNAVQDVSCENESSVYVNPRCKFKLPFHLNQTVAVQMTSNFDRGTLCPNIQLFHMTPNLSFCLQHTSNPVKFLARHSTVPSKPTYKNVNSYIESWMPIIEMESATNSVRNEESATVCGIPLKFEGRNGTFFLNIHYCRMREIEFGNTELELFKEGREESSDDRSIRDVKKTEEFKDIVCSNYFCIRCPVRRRVNVPTCQSIQGRIADENRIWIGHGEFTHMRKRKVDKLGHCFEVRFRVRDDNESAPMKLTDISDRCTLEILGKSKVDRRTENMMKLLPGATALAQAIALAKRIPDLDELHDEIAKEVPRDIEIKHLPKNNHQQQNAIENALTSRFSLIQGPPGTGKTFTGLKLIYLFNIFNRKYYEKTQERRQLVFCGPSNKSVDLVARQVIERLISHDAPKLIRMYGQAYEYLDYPVPGKISSSHRSIRDSKPDEYLIDKNVVLHHVIREPGKPYAAELKEFDKKFHDNSRAASIEDIDKYQEILSKATREEIKNYDVILCTTSMAGNPKLLKATKDRVYQCIIDECGMCTEPECMVPPIATRAEQVVLIGDHKQLQPIILCREAADLGLETSLFERYAKLGKKKQNLNMKYTMLVWQYRMNPKICEFPSETFYDGKLKTAQSKYWMVDRPLRIWKKTSISDHKADPNGHIPLAFCHIEGSEEALTVSTEEGNERSMKNREEAEHVAKVLKYLIEVEKVKISHIQIITQYNSQRHAIKEALTEGHGIINAKISTVVKSQGSEYDYVIFSTVRSLPRYLIENNPTLGWCRKNLGFITDQHQINVALTRARRGLIIIGNKHLLRCDEVWRKLITKYENEKLVYTPQQFPPSRQPFPSSSRGRGGRPTRPPRLANK
ncbi:3'-5' exoribonuclease HELZ2-like isoform X4 [Argopecten irradians]|uniref:3'-5' exoribonuclease HELZ2-like isoform X4 n=1 Tax=Argopecten irradians TaxID=31199 RepID=UPI00371A4752